MHPRPALRPILVAALILALAAAAAVAAPAPSRPGDSADGVFGHRPAPGPVEGTAIRNATTSVTYPTIQAAVDAATAGDVLEVVADPHTEGQVMIDKSLTLRGATGGEVVQAGVSTGDAGDDRAWFLVDTGVDLTVESLVFDGNGFLIYQAFRHKGTGSFTDCDFIDVQYEPGGPAYQGTAIVAFGGDVEVSDCTFTDVGRVGVLFFGTGITGSLAEGNVYQGKGPGDHLDYAFEVGAGALVDLVGNDVSACEGIAASDGSASGGVLISDFFGPGTDALVEGNYLHGNTNGILAGFDGLDASLVEARLNALHPNDEALVGNSPNVTAGLNWWGCDEGPSFADCSSITGPNAPMPGDWLVFTFDAAPPAIPVGGTATFTAAITTDDAGTDVSGQGVFPSGPEVSYVDPANPGPPDVGLLVDGVFSFDVTYAGPAPTVLEREATLDTETVLASVQVTGGGSVLDIPTLGTLGLGALAILVALGGLMLLRRRA